MKLRAKLKLLLIVCHMNRTIKRFESLLKPDEDQARIITLKSKNSRMGNFLASMPRANIIKIGKLLGICLYLLDLPHRRLVWRNLHFCFPEWTFDEIKKFSRGIFKHAGITLLELFQSAFFSRKDLLAMFRFGSGEEHLKDILRDNHQGLIFISCHIGNWELGLQFLGCIIGKPLSAVVRKIGIPWLDDWFERLRTRFGNGIIYKKGAWQKMVQALRREQALMITLDQSRYKQAVEIMFFNHKATTTPAVAMAAMRCKCPVLPIFCVREPDGMQAVHVYPPIELQRTKDLRDDLATNTQKMINVLEEIIRKYPDQWIWFQRPWKKTHPELYPEWEARRRKRRMHKKSQQMNH